ncbi:Fanconi anemia group I protein [Anthophora plagiata]
MFHHFEKLREPANRVKLRSIVQNSSVEELVEIVRNSICKPDAVQILDDLFQTFSDSDNVCQLKRHKLVESTINNLEKAKISAGQANAIINRIIFDFPKYSKEHLVKLVDFCIANIHCDDNELHSWKDLLPVLLETLENEKYVIYADTQVSGSEYKSLIVKAICNCQWDVNLLPSMAKMFGDMTLNKVDRNQLIQNLCSTLPRLSLDRVPSFVYQALKLCKDCDNQKLLTGLSKYFHFYYSKATSPDDKNTSLEDIGLLNIKEIQDIESTVLYHIYQAAQLNHENMRDFIRLLKHVSYASEYMLQPFMLAVLMSVSSIYEDQIFEALKMAVVNSNLEKEKRQSSAWLRQLLPSSCDIIRIIRQVIDSSNKDRHLVLKGLTSLAFMLMSVDQKLKGNTTTAVWCTGSEIIREVVKKRHETVPTVLQELINKIVAGGTTTMHYTDCLKYMCHELSIIVLDHQAWIMTLLERLLLLPNIIANQVLYAIFPLMHVSYNIRENLLLTLRKALYRKGISQRQIAVTGFLEMLKYSRMHSLANFRLSQRYNPAEHTISSSSRSMLTQVTLEYNSQREKSIMRLGCDKTLCHEILDILKKSFTYEFQVRLHLYEGLHDTVRKNLEITEILLDMLLSHFNLYFNTDDNILPPVKFELCTDIHGMEVVLQEPIAQLIFTLQKIYINTIPRTSDTFEKLHGILESLCRRMAATDLEHFNLEHGTDLLHGDFSKSQINLKHVGMAIEVYEALIAFQIGKWSRENEENLHKINDLFKGYTRLTDFIKMQSTKMKKVDSSNARKNRDVNNTTRKIVKSNSIKLPNTVMDLDVISQSLTLLYSESSNQPGIVLRENRNFCRYILHTSEQLVQRARSYITNLSHMRNHRYISTYIEVGRLLCKYFVLNLNNALANDEQVTILALQCFKDISSSVCTLLPSELSRFLNAILQTKNDSVAVDVNSQLEDIIFSLKPSLIASLVEETDDNERKKIPFLLLQIVEQFAYKINFETYNPEKILKCTKKMLQTENIPSPVVPAVVQFCLNLDERAREYGETLNEICLELCEKVGSIDGTEIASNELYKVIREDTVLQIYNVLNSHIKEKLNNACWLLMRLKAEDTISRASGTIDDVWNNNRRQKERNLCKELSHVAQVLHTLANMSVKPGPCTDVTFKNLQYLYHLLGNLTKYFYTKSNDQNAVLQAVKFIQVVQLAGKPLKSAFYNLVTYVEENQNKLHSSKCDSYAQRNKILKETKVIPRVVYEIEQFNKEILLLGKRTGIPLENYMKHSVTRDFRIKNPQLVEALEKMDVSLLTASSNRECAKNAENENGNVNVNDESKNCSDVDAPLLRKRFRIEED